jgi:prepilin-type N-terminal cleavage/methylation domain-containing protein
VNHVQSQTGFTLLEMVVALALSALVSLIGAMALSAGADFYMRSELRLQNHVDLRATERSLRVEWESRTGNVQLTGDAVEFDTATPVSSVFPPGVARVRYSCQPNGGLRTMLVHRTIRIVDDDKGGGVGAKASKSPMGESDTVSPKPVELLKGLSVCKISALSSQPSLSGKNVPVWLESWNAKDLPPRLLRLKLVSASGELPHIVFVAQGL